MNEDKYTICHDDIEKYLEKKKLNLRSIYSHNEIEDTIGMMRQDIFDYISEHPYCTFDEIDNFLQTESLYSDWTNNENVVDVIKKIDNDHISFKAGCLISLVAIIIIALGAFSFDIFRYIAQTSVDNIYEIQINR